jgi:hypothetical protein
MWSWVAIVVAIGFGLAAWVRLGRLSRRLQRLTQSYWDLRYEHGQLKGQVARLEAERERLAVPPPSEPAPGPAAFVPLSALKR